MCPPPAEPGPGAARAPGERVGSPGGGLPAVPAGIDPEAVTVFCPAGQQGLAVGELTLSVAVAPDGRRAVLAYSHLDRLLAGCGEQAAWVQVSVASVQRLVQDADDVDTVWLDPPGRVLAGPDSGR